MPLPTSALTALKRLLTLKDEAAARAAQWNSAVDAQRALPLAEVTQIPRSVMPQRMLQGVYRGYAGDYDADTAAQASGLLYATPQRRVAEQYALRRALQTDTPQHLEMLLVDPNFRNDPALGRAYGHSTMGSGAQAPQFTRARELRPENIEGRTQLYAHGGLAQLKRCSCHG